MPISSITELVASEAWTTWLASAASPPEPSTAEKASSTGRPAATNAPKAISRTRKVIGSDSFSACEKSAVDRLVEFVLGARVAELGRR